MTIDQTHQTLLQDAAVGLHDSQLTRFAISDTQVRYTNSCDVTRLPVKALLPAIRPIT